MSQSSARRSTNMRRFLVGLFAFCAGSGCAAADLSRARVVAPPDLSPREKKAVALLVDEVRKRTGIEWPVVNSRPAGGEKAIVVGPAPKLADLAEKLAIAGPPAGAPEGFRIQSSKNGVLVAGNDERGVLFGVGYLLRHLHMTRGKVALDDDTNVVTAPKYPLRGHQLGYRPKTNSYDAWDLAQWEQYYRDLAVFGANTIELIPPRSDDGTRRWTATTETPKRSNSPCASGRWFTNACRASMPCLCPAATPAIPGPCT
jgi:hypothetical protein